MIDWGLGSGGGIDINGPLFTKDVGDTIRHNLENAVDALAKDGMRMVQENMARGIHGGAWLRAGVEGDAMHRHDLMSGSEVGSLYGRVRMKPGLDHAPGSTAYPSSRVPYIVNRVLESGHYGGTRVSRSVKKTGWKYGRTQRARKAVHQWRDAYRTMKEKAAAIRADLVKGLDD